MKRLADQTLYEILEVSEDARATDIEAAYERARSLYGPGSLATYTLMSQDEAALLTSRLEEAKATLLDPAARARYDEGLRHGPCEGKLAAAPNGAAAPPFAELPPVIPAMQPPRPPPPPPPDAERDAAPAPAPTPPPVREPAAQPSILLANAVASAGAPEPAAAPPILLRREVAAPPREPPPPARPPEPVPVDGAWTGDALRQMREARGITVQQIAERTKVTRHHIENIEGERFGQLPAPVYLRGILLSLARELRLDGQKVARSYLERAAASGLAPGSPKAR